MKKRFTSAESRILKGIPIIAIAGVILHFLFDWSGGFAPLGLISAVNESVWEHLKLAVLPTAIWWTVNFLKKRKSQMFDENQWAAGALVSVIASALTIIFLFYTYTQAFGVEFVWADILIFFVGVTVGQFAGLHFYKYSDGINSLFVFAVLVIIVLLFWVFTFYPPQLPIFKDPVTGGYGV